MAQARARAASRKPREIAIIGELYEEEVREVVRELLEVPAGSNVVLYIDSAGGSVYGALAIACLLRYRRLKASAVVIGECSSAALIVFAACRKRLVSQRSVFLFHRVNWRSDKVRSEEAVNWASHFKWLEEVVDQYQANLFGVAEARFSEWTKEGRFVVGPELVDLGIAELFDA
jgi:ATP-dependent protease ClpP protease subunit